MHQCEVQQPFSSFMYTANRRTNAQATYLRIAKIHKENKSLNIEENISKIQQKIAKAATVTATASQNQYEL